LSYRSISRNVGRDTTGMMR